MQHYHSFIKKYGRRLYSAVEKFVDVMRKLLFRYFAVHQED
jgi:hypothetical protein